MTRLSCPLLIFCWVVVGCSGLLFERPAIAISQRRTDFGKLRFPSHPSNSYHHQHEFFLAVSTRRSVATTSGSPLFSHPPTSPHHDNPHNNPVKSRSFFSRIWLKLSALVATLMLAMSLFLTPANAAAASAASGKYDVSFWTPEMDTTTTTSRVVPTPSSDISSTSTDTASLALDSPILSDTLTRWEPFEDGASSTSSTMTQQKQSAQDINARLDYGMILTKSHGWTTKTIVSAIQLSLLSTLVVTAVIMGKEDLAFRLRQRAFLSSTFGPASSSRRKQPTVTSWSSESRRRASTSLASFLDGLKESTTALRKRLMDKQQSTTQDKDKEEVGVLEEEISPVTEIFTIVDDDEAEGRPNILDYDTVDALLMDGKVIPVEPLLLGDVYERNIQDDKIQKLKKTKLRRNNYLTTTDGDGSNPIAFYDRLMVQAALERAEEEARKEEESKKEFGLRRSGHGARSRQALAKARPKVAIFRNGTMNAGDGFGLQKSSRNHNDNRQ